MRHASPMVVFFAITSLAALMAAPANAHYVYESHLVYSSDEQCLWERAEISHGDGAGYVKSNSRSLNHWGGGVGADCESRYPVPANWLGVQPNLLVYFNNSGGNNGWYLCRNYGNWWEMNKRKVSEIVYAFKPLTSDGRAPCGHRYYGNLSRGAVLYNGEWVTGALWSGYHEIR